MIKECSYSIVIPVYNTERYLGACLDSVLAQTISDWECICIDDGSSDDSGKILDEYRRKDSRFVVFHTENSGEAGARNFALNTAIGRWIVYLDSDDILSPCALEAFRRSEEMFPDADLLRYKMLRFESSGNICFDLDISSKEITGTDVSTQILLSDVASGSFVRYAYKKSLVSGIRFDPSLLVAGDRKYFAEVVALSKFRADIDYVGYWYRRTEGSLILSAPTAEKIRGLVQYAVDSYEVFLKSQKKIEPGVCRDFGLSIGEKVVFSLFHLTRHEKEKGWSFFRDGLRRFKGYNTLTVWQKVTFYIYRMLPLKITAFIFFYLPHWLKLKGFHR